MRCLSIFITLLFCTITVEGQSEGTVCGVNGIFSSELDRCICIDGFAGENCNECIGDSDMSTSNRTFLCCHKPNLGEHKPKKHQLKKEIRFLVPVKKTMVKKLVGKDGKCVFPGELGLDCACRKTNEMSSNIMVTEGQMSSHKWFLNKLNENTLLMSDIYDSFVVATDEHSNLCVTNVTNDTGTTIFIALLAVVAACVILLVITVAWWTYRGKRLFVYNSGETDVPKPKENIQGNVRKAQLYFSKGVNHGKTSLFTKYV